MVKPTYGPVIGFNRVEVAAIGSINLIVEVEGKKMDAEFTLYDCPSVYNVIMGRGWIHEMKGIVSSYHQVMKCLGGIEIRGN